jgi:aminopeptidase YwaD
MAQNFESEGAFTHLRYLAEEIGPRLSGSPAEQRAADYIRTYYESLGLPVREQPFEIPGGSVRNYRFEILEPSLGEIASYPFLFSPDTPPEGLSGEVVFVEGVEEPEIGPRISGKIVVWAVTDLHELTKYYQRLAHYEPLAIVLLYPNLGVGPKHLQIFDNVPQGYRVAPTLFIRWEDGQRVFQAKAKKAHLCMQTERRRLTTRNIIAEVKGSQYPEEIILIGGHYDSVSEVPGAMDNASGTGIVMELARLYASRGSKRTLRFAAWASEEFGLIGSRHYLKLLKQRDQEERSREGFVKDFDKTEMDNHLCVLSLDVLGLALAKDIHFVTGPDELKACLSALSKELGHWCEVKNGFYGTDAEHFALEGIPAIAFTSFDVPSAKYMHGVEDRVDLLDPAHIQRNGELVDAFLNRFAQAKVWPFERKVPEGQIKEVKETLEAFDWMWHPEE